MIHKWCKISSTETSNIPTCIVHSVLFCFRNCMFVTPQEMHNKHPLFIQAIPYVDFPPKISSVTKISLTDRKFLWLPTSSEWSTGNESAEKTQKGLGPDISGSLRSLRKRGGQGLLIQVWGFSFALVSIRFLRDSWMVALCPLLGDEILITLTRTLSLWFPIDWRSRTVHSTANLGRVHFRFHDKTATMDLKITVREKIYIESQRFLVGKLIITLHR